MLDEVVEIVLRAGEEVMKVYRAGSGDDDIESQKKADDRGSPVTKADIASHKLIVPALKKFGHPVVSEEGDAPSGRYDAFWLVDPLDGTKEFIKRHGEFTVNIALIRSGEPVLGVVYAPAVNALYWGAKGQGAFKSSGSSGRKKKIGVNKSAAKAPVVVASKSHFDDKTKKFLEELGPHKLKHIGSSLKICLVAEGAADLYPRLAPTYAWDIAAGDGVLRAAGGAIHKVDGALMEYRSDALLNDSFIAKPRGAAL